MIRLRSSILAAMSLLASACASAPHQPPGAPPSPASVTKAQPGGDAADPVEAALERQLTEKWGRRRDKDAQLVVPMPDAKNYKRVRYWAFDHFVGFRYGADFHVMNVVFVTDVPEGTSTDAQTCLRKHEAMGRPLLKSFDVDLGPIEDAESTWRKQKIPVRKVEGSIAFGFEKREFSAAWVAYPNAYPDACLVFAIAVPWEEHADLARKVVDRWIREGVPKIRPLTKTKPVRK